MYIINRSLFFKTISRTRQKKKKRKKDVDRMETNGKESREDEGMRNVRNEGLWDSWLNVYLIRLFSTFIPNNISITNPVSISDFLKQL